jgi:hypothetical protein
VVSANQINVFRLLGFPPQEREDDFDLIITPIDKIAVENEDVDFGS